MSGERRVILGGSRRGVAAIVAGLCVAAAGVVPAIATADRSPSKQEAKAIKRAFLKNREVRTTVKRIRVSSEDPAFAAVSYSVKVPAPDSARLRAKGTPAPTPAVLKERKAGKWKVVPKAPKKVLKDLGAKRKSEIRITGEVEDVLKRPASCTMDKGYYGAGIYDPGADVYLSVQMPRFHGPGAYPALGVRSLAALSVGNSGGPPQYETGQSSDAFSPSGTIYVDRDGWGLIAAGFARQPDSSGFPPISVEANGYWVCR